MPHSFASRSYLTHPYHPIGCAVNHDKIINSTFCALQSRCRALLFCMRRIVIRMSVCLSVCPLVHLSYHFKCMLTVVVVRSTSDGVAIRYALPVLRMTSQFHITSLSKQYSPAFMCVFLSGERLA